MAADTQRLARVKARVNKAPEGHKGRSGLSFCQPQKQGSGNVKNDPPLIVWSGLDVLLGGVGGRTLTLFYRYGTQKLILVFFHPATTEGRKFTSSGFQQPNDAVISSALHQNPADLQPGSVVLLFISLFSQVFTFFLSLEAQI